MPPGNSNEKFQDILKKIERERKLAEGATHLRKKTNNPAVIQKCNTQVREAQKNIEYLESILKKLQIESDSKIPNKSTALVNGQPYNQNNQRPLFTALDLLKYECPSLGHKIQYMMQLLEFKIQVESQYKVANDKMYNLYQMEGDRSSIAMAEKGRAESDRKLQLLKRALKEYQSMYIDFDDVSRENAQINTVRKRPLTGVLFIQIQGVRNVDHIQSPFFSRNPECIISVKIDDNERARTKGSRNDRWSDNFEINVEKANEVCLTVYDKVNDQMTPVGMIWLSLSDIAEEIRRKKVKEERVSSQTWNDSSILPDNSRSNGLSANTPVRLVNNVPEMSNTGTTDSLQSQTEGRPETFQMRSSGWFSLEPSGEISITFGFIKTNENKNRRDQNNFASGLGRHGAIRQRKEEVVESQGHRFVQKQFYNIMYCAVCNEFLRYTGYQCEDCLFLCHQKCFKNIIAKCISKSSSDINDNDNKLNHKIPHRFVPVTNRGAKWCCHCGYILPFGKKNVRKCDDCGIMCHANCVHYVPDLCGMSPKTIEKILDALRASQSKTKTRPATTKTLQKALPEIKEKQKDNRNFVNNAPPKTVVTPTEETYPLKAVTRSSLDNDMSPTKNNNTEKVNAQMKVDRTNDSKLSQVDTPNDSLVTNEISQAELVKHSHPQHHHHQRHHQKRRHRRRYGLDDFKFISVLGKGNFGKVMLAEYTSNQQLCAIKVLKKNYIVENDEVESTKSEKRVFLVANKNRHPFMVNLYQSFQTENRIYFVMEYISGGDLMWHVQQKKFSLRRAQFYASEILLALKFLHENGIIYRDLKLDNIMLTNEGHIKLADYGLCKENMWYGNTTRTFCGTPELMAPEIISGDQTYDKAVDWWAFGVLLYQMILTKTPFKGDDEEEVFNAILTDEPLYPINMSKESVDIIQKLLTRDPKLRLGAGERDALEIMEHPYFGDVNFDDVLNLRVKPPFIPEIDDPREAKCFEDEFTSQAAKLTPVNSVLSPKMQEMFRGFTYSIDDE